VVQIAFIAVGIILVAVVYFVLRKREKGIKKEEAPLLLQKLDETEATLQHEPQPSNDPEEGADEVPPARAPAFEMLQRRPWMITDLLRALLILLSLVVAAGFILILLPQATVDKMAGEIQARRGAAQPEQIALLYLGDELINNEFHVRGVVRNITTAPIERLDVAIRFFSHDGTILETAIVRLNKERTEPDQVAQFEVVYPNYRSEFGSYSVEFKYREGALVPYKDLRQGIHR
jgi:cbb3-type cytochrome oxidase subunit 3